MNTSGMDPDVSMAIAAASDEDRRIQSLEWQVQFLMGELERLHDEVGELQTRCRAFPVDIINAKTDVSMRLHQVRLELIERVHEVRMDLASGSRYQVQG